jgi:hypothetical protein
VVVAVHVANSFGYMVTVIADGELGRVSAAALVDSFELACSLRGLWGQRRFNQHLHVRIR